MRNTQQREVSQAKGYREEPLYDVFDVVALGEPWPEAGLDKGMWGTVLAVLPGHEYEVEFTDRDGNPIEVATVPENILALVWSEAD